MSIPPHLRRDGQTTQLIVDGAPFLVLGGELGNSSASNPDELSPMFEKLRDMHLNAVLVPVYWDRIEIEEGNFDFSLVGSAIEVAREHSLRLILLWFGTWKNSMSCYAPGWVKRDTARFERVRLRSGEAVEIVSPFCEAARLADANAFAALMRWLREFDSDRMTVLMVQVENEIGMIPEPRDYSIRAEAAYRKAVPASLLERLPENGLGAEVTALWKAAGSRMAGTWEEIFGADAWGEEVFSAWHFATYTEAVAAAGRREYDLPMFANAALMRPGYLPGQYPGGGPLPHLREVWSVAAPTLDMLCPDIYFPNFGEWAERYQRGSNPLFIPEMAASARVSGNAVYAIGQQGAMGVAPFAIETTDKQSSIEDCYRHLAAMSALILEAQRQGNIIALSPQIGFDWTLTEGPECGEMAGFRFEAKFESANAEAADHTTVLPTLGAGHWDAPPGTPLGAALILPTGPEEFAVLGMGVVITFATSGGQGKVGLDSVQEGRYEDGIWHGGRWLNGDQTHQGRHIRFPADRWQVQRVRLYRYE